MLSHIPTIGGCGSTSKPSSCLPNAMAMQAAVEAGAQNAIFVRDGVVTEGGHANLFVVIKGKLTTHPANHLILHGITRGFVLELARASGVVVRRTRLHG